MSRSSRCTEYGSFAALVGEGGQHAVDVALGAGAALHRETIGLVEHHHVAILEQDHRPHRLGVARVGGPLLRGRGGAGSPERGHPHALAHLQAGRNLRPLAGDAHLALAHDLVQVRLRKIGKAAAEPAVEPHSGFVLADLVGGDFVLSAHVRLRTSDRPAHSARTPSATEPPI